MSAPLPRGTRRADPWKLRGLRCHLNTSGKPRRGDLIIYRTGPLALCPVAYSVVLEAFSERRVRHAIPERGELLIGVTPIQRGPLADDHPKAPGTWRFPRDGELCKRRGKWGWTKAPPRTEAMESARVRARRSAK